MTVVQLNTSIAANEPKPTEKLAESLVLANKQATEEDLKNAGRIREAGLRELPSRDVLRNRILKK